MERFLLAHEVHYNRALIEMKNGIKISHWMWYIFPQIKGLGYSEMAIRYAIENINEAKEYMNNKILKTHMLELCNTLLENKSNNALYVMGYPDDLKLRSSMTLFSISNPEYDVFQKVLDKFFDGKKDEITVSLLGINEEEFLNNDKLEKITRVVSK